MNNTRSPRKAQFAAATLNNAQLSAMVKDQTFHNAVQTESFSSALIQQNTMGAQNQPPNHIARKNSYMSQGAAEDVIHIEDFDESKEKDFMENVARPYFGGIFSDIAMRRHSPKKTDNEYEFIDKVAFFEYSNLPGIINDRFYSLFERTKDEHIYKAAFVDGFLKVFLSSVESKMQLTFRM